MKIHYQSKKDHLFPSSQRNWYEALDDEKIRFALSQILDRSVGSKELPDFSKHVRNQYSKCHCAVLDKRSNSFVRLCSKHGLSIVGLRQVTITENGSVLFRYNYTDSVVRKIQG